MVETKTRRATSARCVEMRRDSLSGMGVRIRLDEWRAVPVAATTSSKDPAEQSRAQI